MVTYNTEIPDDVLGKWYREQKANPNQMWDNNTPLVKCPKAAMLFCDDPFCNTRTKTVDNKRTNMCAFIDHPKGRARLLEICNPELANWSA